MGFNTELLHGTKTGDPVTGATLTPVYQSSAFFQPSAEQHEKLFHNKAAGYSYTRINNPTIAAFEERMTVLEKGVASVACASGMAAITNALLNIVGSGDEIITSTSLYGGTIDLYHDLEAFGITTIFADTNDLADLESKITDKTRVIFAETIGNPKLDVTDIPALAGIAKRHNLPLMIDNTVATAFSRSSARTWRRHRDQFHIQIHQRQQQCHQWCDHRCGKIQMGSGAVSGHERL